MTLLPQPSNPSCELLQAIATQQHGLSLQLLQQLPLRNRWNTLFLLQRSFAASPSRDYVRALTHDLLYRAYREEIAGKYDEASRLYRLLIQHGSKLTQKAREGYQRIVNGTPLTPVIPRVSEISSSADHETGIILLQPIPNSQKQPLAVQLARILKTDPYTARLTLPSIEIRMLRHGIATEMISLHQRLVAANIPSRRVSLKEVQAIPVHDVLYIASVGDRLTVQVRNPQNPKQSRAMTLDWSAIQQRVDALLPLFEEVVERNNKGQFTRKTETQDHAQICDLHLTEGQGILRFYDAGYQFYQGIPLVATDSPRRALETKTSWAQWQGLKQLLASHLPPIAEHHKFEHFATTAVEQIEILTQIEAHIHLLRRHECYWDQAFHLYSALHYLNLS